MTHRILRVSSHRSGTAKCYLCAITGSKSFLNVCTIHEILMLMLDIASSLLFLATFALAVPRISLIPSYAIARRAANSSNDDFWPPDCVTPCEASSVDPCVDIPDPQWHACHCSASASQPFQECESCIVANNCENVTAAQTFVNVYNKVCNLSLVVDPTPYMNSPTRSTSCGLDAPPTGPSTTSSIVAATHEGGGPGGPTEPGASPTGSPTGGQSPFGKGGAAGLSAAMAMAAGFVSTAISTVFIL
ncbi:hypothetical protein BJ138DRAFT_1148791 [Hygrophoropsis aurantiaca]|uniref:Uncharacterized protein n=1 Tax=Hygrophoropsis aurantiaca TaxID=72124 RepID=A0ACB8AFE9_9AGAM|nr:hypothetical protein BJ138DRAFT_1148791 [Hygrophoropsis aurantiaca]